MRCFRLSGPCATTAAVLLLVAPPSVARAGGEAGGDAAAPTIHEALAGASPDALLYLQHVTTLSNPFFEGRGTGTEGNRLAQDYIEFTFKRLGLTPAFDEVNTLADGTEVVTRHSSYRQPFPFSTTAEATTQELSVGGAAGAEAETFVAGQDFNVLGFSGTGRVEGPVAFVGYSIGEGPDGYTSYPHDEDLTGKIALLLRFEPMDEDGVSAFTGGRWSGNAGLIGKIEAAVDRHAAAIILVNPPGASDPREGELETAESTARYARRGLEIPVVMMSMDAAGTLLERVDPQGRSLAELRAIADKGESGVLDLSAAKVTINAAVERKAANSRNMGAILPGRGALADEYVVVGAHFDHVGRGYQGGRDPSQYGTIHPGADDNASGTSGMLLAAEKLSRAYAALPPEAEVRSVLFLGFSGEEIGLVGSHYFADHTPISADDMLLMINMDMIGRLRESLEVQGVDTAEGLKDLLLPDFQASGLTISYTPGGTGPSDHTSFYNIGVPVLFFFTGLHREYHTPADVASLINVDGAARIVDLVTNIVLDLADNSDRLQFVAAGRGQRPRMPESDGDEDPAQASGPSRMDIKVRFGIAPAMYGDAVPGVLVGDVSPGTSAAEAGVQPGDRLITWNGVEITDIRAWMAMLVKHEPGDVVQVGLERDGSEITLPVTLKASDRAPR